MCMEQLIAADPRVRCRKCFSSLDWEAALCPRCDSSDAFRSPYAYLFEPTYAAAQMQALLLRESEEALRRAMASFLIVQLDRLEWDSFDRIAIIPSWGKSRTLEVIAEETARMLDIEYSRELVLKWIGPFQWRLVRRREGGWKDDQIGNGKSVLLLDWESSKEDLLKAVSLMKDAFAEGVFVFSIFGK